MTHQINLRIRLGVFVLLLVIAGLAQAATITVGPGAGYDFETIQAGIDAANDGDTVLVAPGEYIITEPITFRGKAITVQSEAGPDHTTIRMGTPADPNRGSVVFFESNETDASVLDGFTITGGKGSWAFIPTKTWTGGYGYVGGGIFFYASSGTVRNCAIVQNIAKHGGGVFCFLSCTPRLIDCTIAENSAQLGIGGGVYLWGEASLTINDCIIRDNSAIGTTKYVNGYGGGGVGQENSLLTLNNCKIMGNSAGVGCGGVGCLNNSSMILTNSIITENSASIVGGGTGGWYGSFTVTDCVIRSNRAQDVGGGIYCGHSSATITNCVIAQNTTADREGGGGVMCSYPDASLTIRNCTIYGNSTENRSWGGGGVLCRNASVTVTNSIIWGNTAPKGREISVQYAASTLAITYSSVADGEAGISVGGGCTLNWGAGNIDAEPLFACIGHWDDNGTRDSSDDVWVASDYHLKSEAGRWDPISESWVIDDVSSPCIDSGDPNHPVGDEPQPNGYQINMGAYGGTSEASMSTRPQPTPQPVAHWKLDEDAGTIAYDSAGRNDAFLVGDPVWQPDAGIVGGALALDGVDDWAFTNPIHDLGAEPVSAYAWIKGGGPSQVILSQPLIAGWLMADTEGKLMTELGDAGLSGEPLASGAIITDGDWHRIGVVLDGVHRKLYVDGVIVAEDSQAGSGASASGFNIGVGKDYLPGAYWSGMLDDIRIYNWPVSP